MDFWEADDTDLEEETTPDVTEDVTEDLVEAEPDFVDLLEPAGPGKPLSELNWQEFEELEGLRHPDYEAQVSFLTDDTGKVVTDEWGDLIRCAPNTPGAQRPDLFRLDEEGNVDILEFKNPVTSTGIYALGRDIQEQTEKRREGFDDPHLTYIVNPTHLTVGNAEYLTGKCEELDVDIAYPFH